MLTSLNSVSHMSVSDSPLEITKDSIPTVDVNNLLFSWKKTEETILDISCFTVQRGETVFLEGPSGSGKSTFLSILAGVIIGFIPGYRIYRYSLAEGMTIRV